VLLCGANTDAVHFPSLPIASAKDSAK
jgi:hypothetical protein